MLNGLLFELAAAAADSRNLVTKTADALPQWAIYLAIGIGISMVLGGIGYMIYLKKSGNWRTGVSGKKLK